MDKPPINWCRISQPSTVCWANMGENSMIFCLRIIVYESWFTEAEVNPVGVDVPRLSCSRVCMIIDVLPWEYDSITIWRTPGVKQLGSLTENSPSTKPVTCHILTRGCSNGWRLSFSRPHETGFGMIWGNYWITILKMAKKIRSVTFDHLSRLLDFKPLFQWPIGCNFQWLCGARLWQLAEEPSGCPAQALQARSFCHWLPQVLRLAPMLCIGAAEWSWRCSHEIQLGEWMVSFLRKDGVLDQIQGGWNSSGDVFCSFPEMDNLPAWEFVFGQSTRWYCYIGNYWKSPIEILDFPIKNCDFP